MMIALGFLLVVPTLAPAQTFGPSRPITSPTLDPTDLWLDTDPHLATDGSGHWVAVWESITPGNAQEDWVDYGPAQIFYSRSRDGGSTWTPAAKLHSASDTDRSYNSTPHIATDGSGTWLAVWSSSDRLGQSSDFEQDLLIARSTDAGANWSEPAFLDSNAVSDGGRWNERPALASDGEGHWVAVWDSRSNQGGDLGWDRDVFVSRSSDGGMSWSAPETLNASAASDGDQGSDADDVSPRIVFDGSGTWVAIWNLEFDVVVTRSNDGGVTWTETAVLASGSEAYSSPLNARPRIATDGGGGLVVAWYADAPLNGELGSQGGILVARSADSGASWSDATPLDIDAASKTDSQYGVDVASDGNGGWLAVWNSTEPHSPPDMRPRIGSSVFASQSTDGGASWTAPTPLVEDPDEDTSLDARAVIVSDGPGRWLAAWHSDDSLGGTIGNDRDIIASRTTGAGLGWTPPTVVSAGPTGTHDDGEPRIANDGAGTWGVVWRSSDFLGGTIGSDLDVLFSRSLDSGATWSAAVPLSTHPGSEDVMDDAEPSLAASAAGTWISAWSSGHEERSEIRFARSTDGTTTWSPALPINPDAAIPVGSNRSPDVATDGRGTWVVTWHYSEDLDRGYDTDILFSRSTDDGMTWSPPATVNLNAATDTLNDRSPRIEADGSGTWLIVWRAGPQCCISEPDLHVQVARSEDNGASWSAAIPITPEAWIGNEVDDLYPTIDFDGAGAWVAGWISRSRDIWTYSDLGVFVAHSVDGGLNWTDPILVSTHPGADEWSHVRHSSVSIEADGVGNMAAAWRTSAWFKDAMDGSVVLDTDAFIARSFDAGTTWSQPELVNIAGERNWVHDRVHVDSPQISADGTGRWLAVWANSDRKGRSDDDIVAARGFGPIAIDIRPGVDTNPVDPLLRAPLPVAILGSESLDVRDVDVASITFGPADTAPRRIRGLRKRSGRRGRSSGLDLNGDGYGDLLAVFRTRETGIAIGDSEACLSARLMDGTPIAGCDSVSTTGACGLGFELVALLPPLMWRLRRRTVVRHSLGCTT